MTRILAALVLCLPIAVLAQGDLDIEISDDLAEARQAWIERGYDGIYDVIRAEAEAGNPVAQNILGASLTEKDGGRGLPYDPAAGLAWYEKAAAQDYVRAIYNMALFWKRDHEGFGNDHTRAQELAERAAAMGYTPALNVLGDMHVHGEGVEKDDAKALEYYRRSADAGYSGGYREVGYAYFYGRGVPVNKALSYTYLDTAVSLGDTKSLPDLAFMLEGNEGVKQDLLKSYLLYQRAMQFRIPRAAYELAWFTEYEGYPGYWHDEVQGYGYCLLAIDWGHTISDGDIRVECAKIAEGFSEAQLAEARAFAESWQ